MNKIVVGVDGSEHSVDALMWAVDEAKVRSAEVDVVYAWQYPTPVMTFEGMLTGAAPEVDFTEEAKEVVERVVKEALGGSDPEVKLTKSPVRGQAAQVLIEASESADLLVVASRGHGGFAGLLLGSVSHQCVQHAKCPVVIIRS